MHTIWRFLIPVLGMCIPILGISGCATNPIVSDYCRAFTPITVVPGDTLTDETAKQILAADETWKKLCR